MVKRKTATKKKPKKKTGKKRAAAPKRSPSKGSGATVMELKRVAVGSVNPAPYNPRKDLQPGDPDYDRLKRSIETFGYVEPCVWNERTGHLVGGHQRFKILRARGDTHVDVSVVRLSDTDERALNVALNKIAGEWDDAKLATVLAELRADEQTDETVTGFAAAEVDAVLAAAAGGGDELSAAAKLGEALEYRVIVECSGEDHQRTLLDRFNREGLSCRALIS